MVIRQNSCLARGFYGVMVSYMPADYVTPFSYSALRLLLFIFFLYTPLTLAENRYMGVGSCASSNCHGGIGSKTGSEYGLWAQHDKHSKAWVVLTERDALKIGLHLGISDPSTDKQCLSCHSTLVENSTKNAASYTVRDGVGCESCHGAAENWLKSHAENGHQHSDNIKAGMKDIVPLEERAKVCLSCHLGNDQQYVNHRLLGAGHPRLSFELDTYSQLQPRHWGFSKEYEERKGVYSPIAAWITGQLVIAKETITALNSPTRSRVGIWPELSLFNCFACHHSLTREEWKTRKYNGRPGELRLNLISLTMVDLISDVIDPNSSKSLSNLINDLHTNYQYGESAKITSQLIQICDSMLTKVSKQKFSNSDGNNLLKKILAFSSTERAFQFEEAEQLAMAISAILSEIDPQQQSFKIEIKELYNTLENPKEFYPEAFTAAANKFSKMMVK